jgi:hypothetical protein
MRLGEVGELLHYFYHTSATMRLETSENYRIVATIPLPLCSYTALPLCGIKAPT